MLQMFINWSFPVFMGYAIAILTKVTREYRTMKNAQRALLKHTIVQTYEDCITKRWVGMYTMQTIESVYDEYIKLGGNGFVKDLVEDLRKLPIYSDKTIVEKT